MDVAAEQPDKATRYPELAKAKKILLDDYIFAPISIEPYRHLVKPTSRGSVPRRRAITTASG